MKHFNFLFLSFWIASLSFSTPLRLREVVFNPPANWKLHQQTEIDQIEMLGFESNEKYLQIYLIPKSHERSKNFLETSEAKVVKSETVMPANSLLWTIEELDFKGTKTQVARGSWEGDDFILVLKDQSLESSKTMREILQRINLLDPKKRSLTGPDFTGKKYYLGFGDYLSGSMGNEVKYDIAHTHDVFTSQAGGDYEGAKVYGPNQGKKELFAEWDALGKLMTEKDMYVQYSSGHGSKTGLMFGPNYKEIRDNALSYPAKEIIIFTMACYSGNLVEAFNQKKSDWEHWNEQGRTLMVMSSSQPSQSSSTGPGKDPQEPGGPSGSAGSAFGHALWKALIGEADGEIDGIKDQFLTLAEIRDFTKRRTKQLGGHTPMITGSYNGNLLMVKVPPKSWINEKFPEGTQSLSDDEIMVKIRELDKELSK